VTGKPINWTEETTRRQSVQIKPNSITLAGSELVRSWFEPDSVMEIGLIAIAGAFGN